MLAIVGESGSGKSTLLQLAVGAARGRTPARVLYRMRDGVTRDLAALGEAERRFLFRTDWGYVHQDPTLGLRMGVSGRRQCRRAADGGRLAALRPHPRHRARLARARRDRSRPHRRHAAHLFRRHAPAPADRAQPRHPAAPGLHGRADRRPRRVGAGAAARPAARPGRRARARRRSSSPTISPSHGCCRTGSW